MAGKNEIAPEISAIDTEPEFRRHRGGRREVSGQQPPKRLGGEDQPGAGKVECGLRGEEGAIPQTSEPIEDGHGRRYSYANWRVTLDGSRQRSSTFHVSR